MGDVRGLPLLESFHASVLAHKAMPGMSRARLRQAVHAAMAREVELLLALEFFQSLRAELPRQALLRVGETAALPAVSWTEWDASWTLEAVRASGRGRAGGLGARGRGAAARVARAGGGGSRDGGGLLGAAGSDWRGPLANDPLRGRPAAVVVLESLPRTPGGEVDLQALTDTEGA